MLPAWVSKLRGGRRNTRTKQVEEAKVPSPAPSPSRKRQDESPPYRFAKTISLQRANSRARKSRVEAEVCHDCSSSYEHNLEGLAGEVATRQVTTNGQGHGGARAVTSTHCTEVPVICLPHDLRSELSNMTKEGMSVDHQNKCPCPADVYDIDTEDSTLTRDTIESSFGSETSSLDSVSGCSEAKEQESPWQADEGVSFDLKRLSFVRSEAGGRICSLRFTEMEGLNSGLWSESSSLTKNADDWSLLMSSECKEERAQDPLECGILSPGERKKPSFNQTQRGNAGVEKEISDQECSFGMEPSGCSHFNLNQAVSHPSSHGCWDDESASIAAENPDLMLACKWQDMYDLCSSNTSSLQNVINEESALNSIENSTSSQFAVWPDRFIEGNHEAKHAAYSLRRGRRDRGTSFSAALPEELQKVVGESVALVKISENPYEDFRQSMYEMIMERDLEELMDVEELLSCYLTLNPPELHDLIKEVFSDVWSSILMIER